MNFKVLKHTHAVSKTYQYDQSHWNFPSHMPEKYIQKLETFSIQ